MLAGMESRNCRLISLTIGTNAHDGRAFASFCCEGNGWGQGGCLPWDRESIDTLIRVCGVADLLACKGSLLRIEREASHSGQIKALVHILDDSIRLDL